MAFKKENGDEHPLFDSQTSAVSLTATSDGEITSLDALMLQEVFNSQEAETKEELIQTKAAGEFPVDYPTNFTDDGTCTISPTPIPSTSGIASPTESSILANDFRAFLKRKLNPYDNTSNHHLVNSRMQSTGESSMNSGMFTSVEMMRDIATLLEDNEETVFSDGASTVASSQPPSSFRLSETNSTTTFTTYNEEDVLCERGHRANHHAGNKRYLEAKAQFQHRYLAAKIKTEKSTIANELVQTVRAWGGRFLRFDKKQQVWYEINDDAARKKASQALREDLTPEEREAKRNKYKYKSAKKHKKNA